MSDTPRSAGQTESKLSVNIELKKIEKNHTGLRIVNVNPAQSRAVREPGRSAQVPGWVLAPLL